MPKLTTCLWFDSEAEAAAKFYASVFKGTKIGAVSRYGEGAPGPKGKVMTVSFTMLGREFLGLNGGPIFKFTEAISLVVHCDTQKEIDAYWKKLTKGGQESQCGWLKDKFGLSWQIVPKDIGKLMGGKNPEKSNRAMQAMLKMVKLDIKKLKAAYDGK